MWKTRKTKKPVHSNNRVTRSVLAIFLFIFSASFAAGQTQFGTDPANDKSTSANQTGQAGTATEPAKQPANGDSAPAESAESSSNNQTGTEVKAQSDSRTDVASAYKLLRANDLGLELYFGYMWQGQSYPTSPTAEAPDTNGIKASPFFTIGGAGMRIGLSQLIKLEPAIEFNYDDYVYKASIGRAFPTQSMTGSDVGPVASILSFLISVPVIFEFPISDRVVWDVGPGLAFYPHIIGEALDGSEGVEVITDYLNGDGRWLYPMVSTGFQFGIVEWLSAGVRFRAFLPLWHVWDSEDLPFWDNLLLNLQLDIVFHF